MHPPRLNFPALFLSLLVPVWLSQCSLIDLPDDAGSDLMPVSASTAGDLEPTSRYAPPAESLAAAPRSMVPGEERLRPLTAAEETGDLGATGVFPPYATGDLDPATRILLVAGEAGDPSALQEVIDQRRHWMEVGHGAKTIACYYVRPSQEQFEAHRFRFVELATEAEGFYLAAPHVIYRHLTKLADEGPDKIHVYVTGDGRAPRDPGEAADDPDQAFLWETVPQLVNQHRLRLDGGPSGHMNERMRLEALRDGIPAEKLLFSPAYLSASLRAFPASCEKTVVLNGDFTGGFVDDGRGGAGFLAGIPSIRVLTAAGPYRRSFGDMEDGRHSMFGSLYLRSLGAHPSQLALQDWDEVFADVLIDVEEIEGARGLTEEQRSEPVYFRSEGLGGSGERMPVAGTGL